VTKPEYITIIAFARICGVSAKTLRFYDEIGLFRPALIDPRTRYRYYVQDQLRDFVRIQVMRDCGASLAEIRKALRSLRSDSEQKRFLQKLRDTKLEAIAEARRSLAWIEGELQDLELQSPFYATIAYCAPVKIASLRTDLKSYADIHQHERSLWEAVAPRPDCSMRGVLWHRCADRGVIEGEPFVEVKKGTACPATYQLKELPGAHVARAFSSLDDDEAEGTHVGLSRWVRARGYRLAGPRREIYRGKLLEIQYPLHLDSA
jgi:DNA-binding transcriptional MerR regulator